MLLTIDSLPMHCARSGSRPKRLILFASIATQLALCAEARPTQVKADFSISPKSIPYDDGMQTVVTLDSSASETSALTLSSIRWVAPGARFVNGTNPSSQVAQVLFEGGMHYAVQLVVLQDGESDTAFDYLNIANELIEMHGEPSVWHPNELWIHGPTHSETDVGPNPFLDYRMVVSFSDPDGRHFSAPGFFAGDGSGNGTGDVFKVRFSPDKPGEWEYRVLFVEGPNVAVSLDRNAGDPLELHGRLAGSFTVQPRDPNAPGFLSQGRLEYIGEHYLKFRDGGYFIKGGTDSPENLLAYRGFDDIRDLGNLGILHSYPSHRQDWNGGDPLFTSNTTGEDSKGIIGAINYLASKHVNSVYFLPMNLGGDGQDTCPFVGYDNNNFNKQHYDVSRLHQWNQVLDHAQRKGIMLHMVLAETEAQNENWFDAGGFGVQRKLFFREMAARFGYLLGLKWNLSEENDFSVQKLREFATFIRAMDPSHHPLAVHTHPDNFDDYQALLGDSLFTSTSIQYNPSLAGQHVETWRANSEQAGQPWVLDMDENNPYWEGLRDDNAGQLRKKVLYDIYFSGGQVEWYAGYYGLPLGGDVTLEDFRTREEMWNYMWYARRMMAEELPFSEMEGADHLLSEESNHWDYGSGEVFALHDTAYAVYLPMSHDTGRLDLSGATGGFRGRWFDPRTGEFVSGSFSVTGGTTYSLPSAPHSPAQDWVFIIRR